MQQMMIDLAKFGIRAMVSYHPERPYKRFRVALKQGMSREVKYVDDPEVYMLEHIIRLQAEREARVEK